MPRVEVMEGEADTALFTAEFAFMPRIGECITKDDHGCFKYYDFVEVWHREDAETGCFVPCVRVQLDD